jgi:imidazolonepropionase-like amidohydrolase
MSPRARSSKPAFPSRYSKLPINVWDNHNAKLCKTARGCVASRCSFASAQHDRWKNAIGSDGPPNPYLNIMFAAIHPARPSEALTVEQAVEAYTRVSAHAEFQEQEKGTIALGKLADLTVLSQDIFTVPVSALPMTGSVLTLVGGEIVYNSGVLVVTLAN